MAKKQKTKNQKVKKRHNKKQDKNGNNEELEDIMAWGKSKQNYYQQQQNQYSQASEEQDEAKEIYQNQYQDLNLNQEQFYQLPEQQANQVKDDDQDEDPNQHINQEYIRKQIMWATQLAKLFEGIKDHNYQFRKKVYDSYLLILMAVRQFTIPYVSQHPLLQQLPLLKKALVHFQKELPTLYEGIYGQNNQNQASNGQVQQNESDEPFQEIQQDDEQEQQQQYQQEEDNDMEQPLKRQSESITKYSSKTKTKNDGLQIYERLKNQKHQQKVLKKAQNKQKRIQKLPKQAFKTISQSQGRLANQKILRNKGLMKRSRRDDGNSRTKLRHKYQKALVKRRAKGYVGVKQNPGRYYSGQQKVLYGKIASTKLK